MRNLETVQLHYQDAHSDKIYNIQLVEVFHDKEFRVDFQYGRRDGHMTEGSKMTTGYYSEAQCAFDRLKDEKVKKGYIIIDGYKEDLRGTDKNATGPVCQNTKIPDPAPNLQESITVTKIHW
jgi:predicted DNA-binding WGR domain protein